MKNIIKIGTRKSKLALIQTDIVKDKIKQAFPELEVEIVKIDTKGDQILDKSLTSFGGKGVFTAELEAELLSGEIDIAVHSAKDMPMDFPEGLGIGAAQDSLLFLDLANVREHWWQPQASAASTRRPDCRAERGRRGDITYSLLLTPVYTFHNTLERRTQQCKPMN